MPKIEIDGKQLEVAAGTMVIQAAEDAGIYIPRFCYHEKLSIAANCRMCLVEVEKAPKPLPACATPVADGMKVYTHSAKAVDAQKGTMEFLLINHPLDCPVCDQGGECPLQDQAMGYGKDISRFTEKKRVVKDKDIGPLIETEMTRCIHCTRCVRFGQEVAGIMELGGVGRGEHMEITTFLGHSVDSEVSGNVIDLCPVGALTNKPYRFTARAWELTSHNSVSPHDCLGTNIDIQTLRGVVKRVLPRTNDEINECWLADRDRYSYEALNSPQRLRAPMIREGQTWRETDWNTALDFAVRGLRRVIQSHGAGELGVLVSPLATTEEGYLIQKLARGLGCHNIDHRLRQWDFGNDDVMSLYPSLGGSIPAIESARAALLVGSNLRKEQPLLNLRLRKAVLGGASASVLNPLNYEFNWTVGNRMVVSPHDMPHAFARIARAAFGRRALPAGLAAWAGVEPGATEQAIARDLREAGDDGWILFGGIALGHANWTVLYALGQAIADATGGRYGILAPANSAGLWLSGCVPHRGPAGGPSFQRGDTARELIEHPRRGYVLFGVEPSLDCAAGGMAAQAISRADFVVAMSAFDVRDTTRADVLLPMAAFAETPGTHINCCGQAQSFSAAVEPPGDARPGWKILRVLGNLLDQDGFDYVDIKDVRAELDWTVEDVRPSALAHIGRTPPGRGGNGIDLERIVDVPLYRVDGIVRRATALQMTHDNPPPFAALNPDEAKRLGLREHDRLAAHQGELKVQLPVVVGRDIPDGCVYIPAGYPETAAVGQGLVRIMRE